MFQLGVPVNSPPPVGRPGSRWEKRTFVPFEGCVDQVGASCMGGLCPALDMRMTQSIDMDDQSSRTSIEVRSPAWMERHQTNAVRLIHGSADGFPGFYLDRLGDCLLATSEKDPTKSRERVVIDWMARLDACGAFYKVWNRDVRHTRLEQASPKPWLGSSHPQVVPIQEQGVHYEARFEEGYSVGLFLDQRDNRAHMKGLAVPGLPRWLASQSASGECLNTFAYTCGFSVCAGLAGWRAVSLDLSKKYLDWGRRNFELNDLMPSEHDFIFGDVFDWLRRFRNRGRRFGVILLDPPTFSKTGKSNRSFSARRDYPVLLNSALDCLEPGGRMLACNNTQGWSPREFLTMVRATLHERSAEAYRWVSLGQPPDCPVNAASPQYLKSVWVHRQT